MLVLILACLVVTAVIVWVICYRIGTRKIQATARSQTRQEKNVMIIQNYNNEGGFFWQMYNILNMLYICKKYNFVPVVLFTTGLYFEKRPRFTKSIPSYDPQNWFNHFFQPINHSSKSQDFWIRFTKKYDVPVFKNAQITYPIMLFNRSTLKIANINKERRRLFPEIWRRYFIIQPHIMSEIDDFKRRYFKNKLVIGMHFRGTDKFPSKTGTEDHPIHFEYDFCLKLLQDYIKSHKLSSKNAVIFIASDEQPFIQFIQKSQLENIQITSTNSIRSYTSTSGLSMDTTKCERGLMNSKVCIEYNNMIKKSVHRGFPDASKYTKGKDVLKDVLLLAESHVFYKSRGNVSSFVGYINPKAKIVDMVDVYQKKK